MTLFVQISQNKDFNTNILPKIDISQQDKIKQGQISKLRWRTPLQATGYVRATALIITEIIQNQVS